MRVRLIGLIESGHTWVRSPYVHLGHDGNRMTTSDWVWLGLGAWFVLSFILAVIVGRMVSSTRGDRDA